MILCDYLLYMDYVTYSVTWIKCLIILLCNIKWGYPFSGFNKKANLNSPPSCFMMSSPSSSSLLGRHLRRGIKADMAMPFLMEPDHWVMGLQTWVTPPYQTCSIHHVTLSLVPHWEGHVGPFQMSRTRVPAGSRASPAMSLFFRLICSWVIALLRDWSSCQTNTVCPVRWWSLVKWQQPLVGKLIDVTVLRVCSLAQFNVFSARQCMTSFPEFQMKMIQQTNCLIIDVWFFKSF